MRPPEEFDYVVEPDVFHDLFGHVPLLFDPMFANHMQAHGAGGLKASRLDGCELPARLCYRIDSYEAGYFVIDSSEQLFDATAPDFTPVFERARGLQLLEAGPQLPDERAFAVST
jgi:phenylalanine-4-hydroxylase